MSQIEKGVILLHLQTNKRHEKWDKAVTDYQGVERGVPLTSGAGIFPNTAQSK